jgi:ribose 5-phosphate isomerase RpiB
VTDYPKCNICGAEGVTQKHIEEEHSEEEVDAYGSAQIAKMSARMHGDEELAEQIDKLFKTAYNQGEE